MESPAASSLNDPVLPDPSDSPSPISSLSDQPQRVRKSLLVRILVRMTLLVVAIVVGILVTVGWKQRGLIYHPRPEPANTVLPEDGIRISFRTEDGLQSAIYLPVPGQGATRPPGRLWVLCSGNASLGRDWLGYLDRDVRKGGKCAILLVDYPGYGLCEGQPTEASIQRTMDAVLDALAADRGWAPETVRTDLRVLGFSLGSGAALKLAAREPVREVLLLAPFTSLRDAAKVVVGSLFSRVVLDHFDNRARLRELAQRTNPPPVTFCHGTGDRVIPHSHSEELARIYGPKARLVLNEGADHALKGADLWKDVTARLRGDLD